jgi:putative PIN family toxin of toxin-antitoxin system
MGERFERLRVVLDTNTVLSAVLFPQGRLVWMRDSWVAREYLPLISRETSEELIRALAYPKFSLDEEEIEVLLGSYLPYTEVVEVGTRAPKKLPQCRDPHDQKFLLLAWYGKADVLVTGDQAILELSDRTSFGIEQPAQFKKRFL